MIVLAEDNTIEAHAQERARKLRALGCSEAHVQGAVDEILAHTVVGPEHYAGTVWLRPDEDGPDRKIEMVPEERRHKGHSFI